MLKEKHIKFAGCIAVGIFLAFGRYPVSWLLSSKRKNAEPKKLRPRRHYMLKCPGRNTLYVEVDGPPKAHTLVLIHGLNSSSRQWFYQQEFFRQRYQLIIIDLPGHGRSPRAVDLSIATLASDLRFILQFLSIKDPVIWGHSMGAMICMAYCADEKRGNIRSVILQHGSFTNPLKTCRFPGVMQFLQEPVLRPFLRFVKRHPTVFRLTGWANYFSGMSLIFYRYLLFSGKQTAAQLRFMGRIGASNPPQDIAEGLLKCLEFEASAWLHRIQVPALVIGGTFDRVTEAQACSHIAATLQNGRLSLVEGGHLSLVEAHAVVNHTVNTFLRMPV